MSNKTKKQQGKKNIQQHSQGSQVTVRREEGYGTRIFLIIFAIVAILGIAASIIYAVVEHRNRGRRIDYLNDKLSKYVYISEDDYKNVTVDSSVTPVTEIDVKTRLVQILAEYTGKVKYDGAWVNNATLGPGDSVNVWYRGYMLREDGSKEDFSFKLDTLDYVNCEIGGGSYLFEHGLVGANRDDYARLSVREDGVVKEGDLVEIKYYVVYADGSGDNTANRGDDGKLTALVDLGSAYTLDKYGTEFSDRLVGKEIGEELQMFSTTLEDRGGQAFYTGFEIVRAYEYTSDKAPLTVTVEFPYNYANSEELRGKTAYFDVFIKNAIHYESAVLNDAFVTEKLKLTADDLKEYEGESLSEKYMSFLREYLDDEREAEKQAEIESALWEHYLNKAEIKKKPNFEIKAVYNELYAELRKMYNSDESAADYGFDGYVAMIMGLETEDWQSALSALAEEMVIEKLVKFYIIVEENLIPSEEEYQQVYDDMINNLLIDYLAEVGCKRENFDTEEKYNERVELYRTQMISYYGEDSLKDEAYYIHAIKTLKTYATIE